MMKSNSKLLQIWDNKERSYRGFWEFELLNSDDKTRTFYLILDRQKVLREIGLKNEVGKWTTTIKQQLYFFV